MELGKQTYIGGTDGFGYDDDNIHLNVVECFNFQIVILYQEQYQIIKLKKKKPYRKQVHKNKLRNK